MTKPDKNSGPSEMSLVKKLAIGAMIGTAGAYGINQIVSSDEARQDIYIGNKDVRKDAVYSALDICNELVRTPDGCNYILDLAANATVDIIWLSGTEKYV